jgi:phosphoenolpyruvate synthase/pyruvate phosphate dikinase
MKQNIKNAACLLVLSLLVFSSVGRAGAQMARKPTPTREPKGAMPATPDSKDRSLPKVDSQADFDSIARTYHQGTPFALPHVMFIIDRKNKNKIYYVNSQRYRFHKDFLLANYLIPRGSEIFKPVYVDQDRRFIVGTIAWQKPVEKFTWELWEGDLANPDLIKLAHDVINKTFFQPVSYKPNSIRQEDASADLHIPQVSQDEITKNQAYLALNTGTAIGRVHIIEKLDDTVEVGSNEILVIKELPLTLPQVRGVIVAKSSTPLSHINILARGWGIPNVYIKDADKLFKEYDTRWIKFEANLTSYKTTPADKEILDKAPNEEVQVPPADLNIKKLAGLREMRAKDSIVFGSKSANLGEMLNKRLTGAIVPDGFTIPFYWYDKFIKDNKFDDIIDDFEDDNDFVHNPSIRRKRLEEFRNQIINGKFDDDLRRELVTKWKTQLGGKPVFVRSSSNSEDLPNFSGAGLYSSVPNVRNEEEVVKAVKKVWASLWNFQAYEARVRNFVSQKAVYMSALVQVGVNMDRGGVMVTKDPFDDESKNNVYISTVCGHNTKVTDNDGIPEQILFNPKSNSVILMTLSQQKNALTFDEKGDLKEIPDNCANPRSRRILSDLQARLLAKTALGIRTIFGGKKEQDIEWGIMRGQIYIVQARPYIEKKN